MLSIKMYKIYKDMPSILPNMCFRMLLIVKFSSSIIEIQGRSIEKRKKILIYKENKRMH